MADGKQCDRCKRWEIVERDETLPEDWEEFALPNKILHEGKENLHLCYECAREFRGAEVKATEAYIREFKERFWPT